MKPVINTHKGKCITSDAVRGGFKNGHAGGRGNGCVNGITTFFNHIESGLGGKRLGSTHHAFSSIDNTSSGRVAVF